VTSRSQVQRPNNSYVAAAPFYCCSTVNCCRNSAATDSDRPWTGWT